MCQISRYRSFIMQGTGLNIRRNLGFSVLFSDTLMCRQEELGNQPTKPANSRQPTPPLKIVPTFKGTLCRICRFLVVNTPFKGAVREKDGWFSQWWDLMHWEWDSTINHLSLDTQSQQNNKKIQAEARVSAGTDTTTVMIERDYFSVSDYALISRKMLHSKPLNDHIIYWYQYQSIFTLEFAVGEITFLLINTQIQNKCALDLSLL